MAGYARNENDVARDLYEFLRQFFTLYEDYRGNPFFVTGESYAGKYKYVQNGVGGELQHADGNQLQPEVTLC